MTTCPGTGLRRLAARLLPPATIERFVDPAIADLQHEHASTLKRHPWRAHRVRTFGTLRLLQLIALLSGRYGLQRGWERLSSPPRSTVVITETAMGTIGALMAMIAVGMVVAIGMMASRYRGDGAAQVQIVAFSILSVFDAGGLQFGFALAQLMTIDRPAARRFKAAGLLAMAALFSAASVYMIGVTVSAPRFLSHAAVTGHSLAFIRPGDVRSMVFAYGTRLAAGVSPLLFCAFAFALGRRLRLAVAFPAAVSVWTAYVVWFTLLRQPLVASSLPVSLAVWAPDVAIVVATLLLAFAHIVRTDRVHA